jgi:hypothetical protein
MKSVYSAVQIGSAFRLLKGNTVNIPLTERKLDERKLGMTVPKTAEGVDFWYVVQVQPALNASR